MQLDPVVCFPENLGIQLKVKIVKRFIPSPLLQTICSENSLKSKDVMVRLAAVKYLVTSIKKVHECISSVELPSKIVIPAIVKHLNQVCCVLFLTL